MKRLIGHIMMALIGLLLPFLSQAQTIGGEVQKLHTVLENLYDEMIPLCSQLITVARGLASFAATFYIGYRVWKHIANAEAIDFFPLFRPFVLAVLIGIFPTVLGILNGVLKPTVLVTEQMVQNSNDAIYRLMVERDKAIRGSKKFQVLIGESGFGDRKEWYKYTHPGKEASDEGIFESLGNTYVFMWQKMWYSMKYILKLAISFLLELLYYAASLCIDTIRTFHLVVLSILGPLVFALAIFDGFQHTLSVWLARYINIYMWLPCANLFGSILGRIQEHMIKMDISQLEAGGDTFFTSADVAYIIFTIIGIVGYFTIPGVANYIVHASGANPILVKTNNLISSASHWSISSNNSSSSAGGSYAGDKYGDDRMRQSFADASNSEPYFKEGGSSFQHDKLSG